MRGFHFAVLAFITFLTSAFVWVRLQIISISYDIHALEAQEREIREACNSLALRINEARSPQRLERLATTRFNMQPPRSDQIVVMRSTAISASDSLGTRD